MADALKTLVTTLLIVAAIVAVALICGGCVSENTGTSTVVGEQLALPEITDSSDSVAVRVYESIKGARVWTAKNSKVTVEYDNCYTNRYFGIVETQDQMKLKVRVEPCEETSTARSGAVATGRGGAVATGLKTRGARVEEE